MIFHDIEALESTGLVRTVFTEGGSGHWRAGEPGAEDSWSELLSHLGIAGSDAAFTRQRHSDAVVPVRRSAERIAPLDPQDGDAVDGLVTDEEGLLLATVEADCVPVYLLDPVRRAVGMIHSGWKGTAACITVNAVSLMAREYGTRPEDLLVVFGPCICADCYEVGAELRGFFSEHFSDDLDRIFRPVGNEKFLLDVKEAVRISLLRAGLLPEHITDCGRCVLHEGALFSYRGQRQKGEPGEKRMLTGILLLPK